MGFELFCALVITIFFGLAVAFFGYRLFLLLLPLWGFIFGFALGAQTITALFSQGFLATATSWVVGFIVGLVFALLSYLFYMFGVAILSASFGYAIGIGFMGLFGATGWLAWLVGIILAVVVAGVVIYFNLQKYAVEIITGAMGSAIAIGSLMFPLGIYLVDDLASGGVFKKVMANNPWWALFWIILAVVAIVFQWRQNKAWNITPPEDKW